MLAPQLPPEVLREVREIEAREDFDNPRYEALLMEHFYPKFVLRQPLDQWPPGVLRGFEHMNKHVYVLMPGPSEFGVRGRLVDWDRSKDLGSIRVPTLVIGAAHDTMDPRHMEWMAAQLPHGRYLLCPNGSHLAMWDDEDNYFKGVLGFLHDVDEGRFPTPP